MATVYVLKSLIDDKLYVGSTDDFNQRIKAHNSGKVRSTKARKPFKVVYQEELENIAQAREREKFFKTGVGRKILNGLMERWPSG